MDNEIKTRFKRCIDQYYHFPNTKYIKDHQLDYIGGVLQAALHILPTDDYFYVKQYVFDKYGYDPGGCQTRQIELSDYVIDGIDSLPSVNSQASKEDIHREREQSYMRGYEDASRKYRIEQSEDAISRDWLKGAIHNFYYGLNHTPTEEDIQAYIDAAPSVSTEKTGRCKDCKWWKDSDGVYRRGIGAESRCPINTVSVANGVGYCYMFKPQPYVPEMNVGKMGGDLV